MAKDTDKKIKAAVRLLEKHGYTIVPPAESVVIDTKELNKRKLEPRRLAFIDELRVYQGTYTNDMLNAFYLYWTEPNKTFTKMRFEMEPVFDMKRRLGYWHNRNKNGRKTTTTDEDRTSKLADILTD